MTLNHVWTTVDNRRSKGFVTQQCANCNKTRIAFKSGKAMKVGACATLHTCRIY